MTTLLRPQRRHFFSIPDAFSSKKQYKEKKLLNFSQNQIYNVVSNVNDYKFFVPFCNHSHVYTSTPLRDGSYLMKAELGVGFKLFEEKYMSKVTCRKPTVVKAVAADAALFNDMTTTWQFTPNLPPSKLNSSSSADHPSCWVDFDISFEFASPIHAQASSVFFDQVSKMMLQAFIDRCQTVYRK